MVRSSLNANPRSHIRQLAIESVAVTDGQVAGARIATAAYVLTYFGADPGVYSPPPPLVAAVAAPPDIAEIRTTRARANAACCCCCCCYRFKFIHFASIVPRGRGGGG